MRRRRDGLVAFGPCKKLVLVEGKKLSLECEGSSLGFDLDGAAAAGAFGLVVRVADAWHSFVFVGTVTGAAGRWTLCQAPTLAMCPGA